MADPVIEIEVVYAAVDRQRLLALAVPQGTTVRAAVLASGIDSEFPELDLLNCPLGIFGKQVAPPAPETAPSEKSDAPPKPGSLLDQIQKDVDGVETVPVPTPAPLDTTEQ